MLIIAPTHISPANSKQAESVQPVAPLQLSSVIVYPVSPDIPILVNETGKDASDEETVVKLEGAVEIPLNGEKIRIAVSGTISGTFSEDGTFSVSSTFATGAVQTIEISQELCLQNVTVALISCRYRADVRIAATVSYHDRMNALKTEGQLNDNIQYSKAGNRQTMFISTLLQNATLYFSDGCSLPDGTVRFFLWSHPAMLTKLNSTIQEDNELLYQAEHIPALSFLHLKGIPDKPITFGARLYPQGDRQIFLEFEIFPAQLNLQFISSDTELFIHGENYDAPFILKTRDTWNAEISNNVHLGITAPVSGNLMLKSFILVKGTVKGVGLEFPEIEITSQNTFTGILFPDSTFSQNLPYQDLHLFFNSAENMRLPILMPSPLQLAENITLITADGTSDFPAVMTANTITATTPLNKIQNQGKTGITGCMIDSHGKYHSI